MEAAVIRADGIRFSASSLAREFAVTRDTVLRRLSARDVQAFDDGRGHLLLPVEQSRAELAFVVKASVQLLETLPDVLDRDCGLGHEAIARVEAALDALRENLYAALMGDEPVPEIAVEGVAGDTIDVPEKPPPPQVDMFDSR